MFDEPVVEQGAKGAGKGTFLGGLLMEVFCPRWSTKPSGKCGIQRWSGADETVWRPPEVSGVRKSLRKPPAESGEVAGRLLGGVARKSQSLEALRFGEVREKLHRGLVQKDN